MKSVRIAHNFNEFSNLKKKNPVKSKKIKARYELCKCLPEIMPCKSNENR